MIETGIWTEELQREWAVGADNYVGTGEQVGVIKRKESLGASGEQIKAEAGIMTGLFG